MLTCGLSIAPGDTVGLVSGSLGRHGVFRRSGDSPEEVDSPGSAARREADVLAGVLAVTDGWAAQAVALRHRVPGVYLMIWMWQRAAGAAVMRSSPVTRVAPVSSARAT